MAGQVVCISNVLYLCGSTQINFKLRHYQNSNQIAPFALVLSLVNHPDQ